MIRDDDVIGTMLSTIPVCASVWNHEGQALDCNDAALRLFGLANKQSYLDYHTTLSPAQQPGGEASGPLLRMHLHKAFAEGRTEFDWQHCRLDGAIIPTRISLTRIRHGSNEWVVAYTIEQPRHIPTDTMALAGNARARLILDNAPIACNFWNESGEIIDCNLESLRLFGLSSKEEFIARFDELLPEFQPGGDRSKDLMKQYAQQALQTGRLTMPIPWMRRTASGESLPSESTLVRVMEDGKPMLAVFVRDLREELQLQAEKREANEYTQLMLDATPLCCNLWNEAHDNIACNQAAVALFGLRDKQEYLDRFFELSPEYQPCGGLTSKLAHEHISTAFRDGYARFEWLHQQLDGEPVPAEITLVRVARDGGFIVAGYTRDLREELKLLAEKHDADERMQLMLDATPLGCAFWDEDARPIDCNLAVLKLFGLSSKRELLNCYPKLAPERQPCGRLSAELRAQYVQQARRDGYVQDEWMCQTLEGELIPAEITLVRVRRAKGYNIAVYIRDLREEKKLKAEKHEADEHAQLMLDAMPLSCSLWNETHRLIACNQEALKLFGLEDKQQYLDRFFELSPKHQPCGRLSGELAHEHLNTAFREGYTRFPWMRQTLSGEQVPSEITMVRVGRNEGFIVAAYTRDLREELKLQADKHAAEERMQIMLDSTPLGCTIWDEESRPIDCNLEVLRLFGCSSKQEFMNRYAALAPVHQPCGRLSAELRLQYVRQAHRDGYVRAEWMYQTLDGEPLPAEVTLVRARRAQGNIIAVYMRDLREERKLQAEKREVEERMQIMLDATPLGCTFWDEDSRLVDCNQEAVNLFGLEDKQAFLARFQELSPERQPDGGLSAELIPMNIQQAHRDGYMRLQWIHQNLDGEQIPVEVTLVHIQRAQGQVIVAYLRDLREELKLQAEKREANEYTQLMLDATPLSCSLWNEAGQKIACNQEAVKLFGLRDKQEYLDRYHELSPEYQPCGRLSRELTHEHISTAFREGHARFEWMHQQLDGEPVPVEVTLVRVAHNGSFIVAGYTRDLRELKNTVDGLKRMEALAYTDKLTGVGNRHYFLEQATPGLAALGPREAASLLILDIDHFKRVNDTYGHSAGDVILQNVAKRIRKSLRPDDLFARYGGEEFVILLARSSLSAALALAERVRETIAERPFEYQSDIINVTISIGVTYGDNAATPLQDLIDQADTALYQAKHNGRNRVERYQPADVCCAHP